MLFVSPFKGMKPEEIPSIQMIIKKTVPLLFALLVCLLYDPVTAYAQDGAFSDATTLRNGRASLGIQTAIYTESGNEAMLIFRGAYGVRPGLSFHGKVGLLHNETYLGGHLEYGLAGEPADPVSLSMLAGIYAFWDPGLKVGGVLSKQLGQFSLFTGLTFEPLFTDPETQTPLLVPIGMEIPVGSSAHLVLEADVAANDDADRYQAIHMGFNFYF